jgi:hypothetical protein
MSSALDETIIEPVNQLLATKKKKTKTFKTTAYGKLRVDDLLDL